MAKIASLALLAQIYVLAASVSYYVKAKRIK
jgi:hypothetical protein